MKILRRVIYIKLGKSLSWAHGRIASRMLKKHMSESWTTGHVRSMWLLSRYHSDSWTDLMPCTRIRNAG